MTRARSPCRALPYPPALGISSFLRESRQRGAARASPFFRPCNRVPAKCVPRRAGWAVRGARREPVFVNQGLRGRVAPRLGSVRSRIRVAPPRLEPPAWKVGDAPGLRRAETAARVDRWAGRGERGRLLGGSDGGP